MRKFMRRDPHADLKSGTQTSVPLSVSLLGQITDPSDTSFLFSLASQVGLKDPMKGFGA